MRPPLGATAERCGLLRARPQALLRHPGLVEGRPLELPNWLCPPVRATAAMEPRSILSRLRPATWSHSAPLGRVSRRSGRHSDTRRAALGRVSQLPPWYCWHGRSARGRAGRPSLPAARRGCLPPIAVVGHALRASPFRSGSCPQRGRRTLRPVGAAGRPGRRDLPPFMVEYRASGVAVIVR